MLLCKLSHDIYMFNTTSVSRKGFVSVSECTSSVTKHEKQDPDSDGSGFGFLSNQ